MNDAKKDKEIVNFACKATQNAQKFPRRVRSPQKYLNRSPQILYFMRSLMLIPLLFCTLNYSCAPLAVPQEIRQEDIKEVCIYYRDPLGDGSRQNKIIKPHVLSIDSEGRKELARVIVGNRNTGNSRIRGTIRKFNERNISGFYIGITFEDGQTRATCLYKDLPFTIVLGRYYNFKHLLSEEDISYMMEAIPSWSTR